LQQGMRNRLYQQERTLNNLTPRLMRQSPDKKLSQASHQLMQIQTRLEQAMQHKLQHAQNSLALQASRLDSVSPLNVLARGYSITKTQQGKVIKSVDHIKTGDVLITELADGAIKSTVL
ncbi:MAG: exodeoxyribonuclease VII large subunit, partial [Pseudoalteromonas sp.]|nr:exodeoxyribonuclease VII large subunit [Pseudoalteromonas sp.]